MQQTKALLFFPGYEYITIGFAQNHELKTFQSIHKHDASKVLISTIDTLLHEQHCAFHELDCIAVNVGPGPFTTLRVAIATVNGLAYGSAVPLISVDGFDVLINQAKKTCTTRYLGVTLNAFSDDVYWALYDTTTGEKTTVCLTISSLVDQLKNHTARGGANPWITLVGNGTIVYQDQLSALQDEIVMHNQMPTESELLEIMLQDALQAYQNNDIHTMLLPQYMKAMSSVIHVKK